MIHPAQFEKTRLGNVSKNRPGILKELKNGFIIKQKYEPFGVLNSHIIVKAPESEYRAFYACSNNKDDCHAQTLAKCLTGNLCSVMNNACNQGWRVILYDSFKNSERLKPMVRQRLSFLKNTLHGIGCSFVGLKSKLIYVNGKGVYCRLQEPSVVGQAQKPWMNSLENQCVMKESIMAIEGESVPYLLAVEIRKYGQVSGLGHLGQPNPEATTSLEMSGIRFSHSTPEKLRNRC